jgi:hypothetical protein
LPFEWVIIFATKFTPKAYLTYLLLAIPSFTEELFSCFRK